MRGLISENPMLNFPNLREPKTEVDPFDLNEGLLVVDASEKLGTLISELRTPSTGVTPVSQMFTFRAAPR